MRRQHRFVSILTALVLATVTAYEDYNHLHRAADAGFDLHFTKPANPAEVLDQIGDCVRKQTEQRETAKAADGLANGVLRVFGVEPKDEATSTYTLDEVANIVAQSTREGTLEDSTGTLTAAFEFTTKKVAEVLSVAPWLVEMTADRVCAPADRVPG